LRELVFTYLIELLALGVFFSVVPVAWLKLAKKEALAWWWASLSVVGWVLFGYWFVAF